MIAVVGQYILSLIFMATAAIIGVVMYPKWMKITGENATKSRNPDTSGALRLKDLFLWFSWPLIAKLERIYGEYKAMLLWITVLTSVVSIVMLVLHLLYSVKLATVGICVGVAFVFFLILYQMIKENRMPHFY